VHQSRSWLVLGTLATLATCAAFGCNGSVGSGEAADGAVNGGSGGAPAGGSVGGTQGTSPGSGGAGPAGSGGALGTGGAPTTGGTGSAGGRSSATGGVTGTTGSGGVTGAGGGVAGSVPFKGVANAACADLPTLKVAWYYNWTTSPGSCAAPGFVPMVAGKSEKTPAAVTTAITKIAGAGYTTVLGFNEPNKVDQSNLTVVQALGMWPQLTANAALRVGSPATSADAPGQAWFTDFMTQATAQSLRVDFIALHWYGWNAGSCDAKAAQLESYIRWAEAIPGNRPIWITEWGCLNLSNPDPATVQAFYTGALAVFAKHPRIERYAWYPWTVNNELVAATGGTLTSLGTALANAPAFH
jgi:hypothetical protein